MAYKVTAPLVITKKEDGSDLYLYHDAVVPDFVSDDEVKRLVDEGFVEKLAAADVPGDGPAKPARKPAAESN